MAATSFQQRTNRFDAEPNESGSVSAVLMKSIGYFLVCRKTQAVQFHRSLESISPFYSPTEYLLTPALMELPEY
jgi:hypothetical protein